MKKAKFVATILSILIITQTVFLGGTVVSAEGVINENATILSENTVPYDPYYGYTAIYTKEDLNNVRNNLSGNYYLANDIVFEDSDFAEGGAFYNGGLGWLPLGGGDNLIDQFTGIFDGKNHKIINLVMKPKYGYEKYSLFNFNKGLITRLTVDVDMDYQRDITSSTKATYELYSAICAENYGNITYCNSIGKININLTPETDGANRNCNPSVGGIAAINEGNIYYCSNSADICITVPENNYNITYNRVGGIAAINNNTIRNCYNDGNISKLPTYSTGNSTFDKIGGISGVSGGKTNCCYNVGAIYYTGYDKQINSNNNYENCFSNIENMKQKYTYTNWDFDTIWKIDEGNDYPRLRQDTTNIDAIQYDFDYGYGTEEYPYLITTKEQLANVIKYTKKSFRLVTDINLTEEDYGVNGLFSFSSYNLYNSNTTFSGVFDGNDHTISGVLLTQIKNCKYYAFPFFETNTGTIKNLLIDLNSPNSYAFEKNTNSLVSPSADISGIVNNNNGTISNCSVSGIIICTGTDGYLRSGGIATINSGIIENCKCSVTFDYTSVSSSSGSSIGGIIGLNYNQIKCCTSSSQINLQGKTNGKCSIGGIVGQNSYTWLTNSLDQCYFNGDLVAELESNAAYAMDINMGGIVGINDINSSLNGANVANISNCFNIGTESLILDGNAYTYHSDSLKLGGIAGTSLYTEITNCYSTGGIDYFTTDNKFTVICGQLIGAVNTSTVTNSYACNQTLLPFGDSTDAKLSRNIDQMKLKETYAGFDFDNIWEFGTKDNYFYPTLKNVAFDYTPKPIGVYVESYPKTIAPADISKPDLSGLVVKRIMNNGTVEDTNQFGVYTVDGGVHYGDNTLVVGYDDGTYFYYSDPFTINISSGNVPPCSVSYNTHVQDIGWKDYVSDGQSSGTVGESKRLEGIHIKIDGDSNLGVEYATHVQDIGWQDFVVDNEMSGTEGQCKRLEAIKIKLTGIDAELYDIYYRVHAQDYGWLGWAKNGDAAGTEGLSKRLEAIEIRIVKKTENPNLDTSNPFVSVYGNGLISYRTHVQNFGWQNYVSDGAMSGTQGQSLRLEGINIRLNTNLQGDIYYMTHVQDIGWMDPVCNNQLSGTQGQSKRLEAIAIALDGEVAEQYDIYYRVHAQNVGWMGWAKNGEPAGTEGFSYRLEGIQIVIVPKGGAAPGDTNNAFLSNYNYLP